MKRFLAFLLLAVLTQTTYATDKPLPPGLTPELVEQLRQGGYTLYLRHASTNYEQVDRLDVDFKNCSTQRNLNAKGRAEAQAIGKTIKQLQIPIGDVLSSPFCRCKETAQLAFGEYQVNPDLQFSMSKNSDETDHLAQALDSMLKTSVPPGDNRVLVSHSSNLRETTRLWPKPEGVMFVFQLDNQGQYQAIARITPTEWSEFINQKGRSE